MNHTIHDACGHRLYLTPRERINFLAAASELSPPQHAFCATLALTGCRISEALNLTYGQIDHELKVVVIESLKKRKKGSFRTVPVPEHYLCMMRDIYDESAYPRSIAADHELWGWCRTTGYTIIKDTMAAADIAGPHACPKGLRHGFAIHALSKGIPLNMIQKWMGHSSIEITSIYLQAVGDEEYRLAEMMWAS